MKVSYQRRKLIWEIVRDEFPEAYVRRDDYNNETWFYRWRGYIFTEREPFLRFRYLGNTTQKTVKIQPTFFIYDESIMDRVKEIAAKIEDILTNEGYKVESEAIIYRN